MTEAEAKTKWCPFARTMVAIDSTQNGVKIGPVAGFSVNRFSDDRITLCLGSACMAWRWETAPTPAGHSWDAHPGDGFCGLAGRP